MNLPRIAIPIPTTADLAYNRRSWPAYASAVQRSGGQPVELPLGLSRSETLQLAETCAGFCLPGSPADVDPSRYGQELDPATAPDDPTRYAADQLLLEHATAAARPVLAICYGLQSLNVWAGGSLVQDLTPLPVNHSAGGAVAIAHSTLIPDTSLLAAVLTSTEVTREDGYLRLPVNTSHHQAVASAGDTLRIVARCPEDGVIEALEADAPARILALQWHPERSYDISPASRALFDWLIREALRPSPTPSTFQAPTPALAARRQV